jgi:hypothetical protein
MIGTTGFMDLKISFAGSSQARKTAHKAHADRKRDHAVRHEQHRI